LNEKLKENEKLENINLECKLNLIKKDNLITEAGIDNICEILKNNKELKNISLGGLINNI
jgi:hypothetical protein